jgi:hypothetical protein
VRIEFHPPDEPDRVVGTAEWDGRRVVADAEDDEVRTGIQRVFRPTPVVVDDPSLRPQGSRGEVALQPGSLAWFRSAGLARAGEIGLAARVVPGVVGPGGWDPAAAYRPFRDTVERVIASGQAPGGARPSLDG